MNSVYFKCNDIISLYNQRYPIRVKDPFSCETEIISKTRQITAALSTYHFGLFRSFMHIIFPSSSYRCLKYSIFAITSSKSGFRHLVGNCKFELLRIIKWYIWKYLLMSIIWIINLITRNTLWKTLVAYVIWSKIVCLLFIKIDSCYAA